MLRSGSACAYPSPSSLPSCGMGGIGAALSLRSSAPRGRALRPTRAGAKSDASPSSQRTYAHRTAARVVRVVEVRRGAEPPGGLGLRLGGSPFNVPSMPSGIGTPTRLPVSTRPSPASRAVLRRDGVRAPARMTRSVTVVARRRARSTCCTGRFSLRTSALATNPRMAMPYKNLAGSTAERRAAIIAQAVESRRTLLAL